MYLWFLFERLEGLNHDIFCMIQFGVFRLFSVMVRWTELGDHADQACLGHICDEILFVSLELDVHSTLCISPNTRTSSIEHIWHILEFYIGILRHFWVEVSRELWFRLAYLEEFLPVFWYLDTLNRLIENHHFELRGKLTWILSSNLFIIDSILLPFFFVSILVIFTIVFIRRKETIRDIFLKFIFFFWAWVLNCDALM